METAPLESLCTTISSGGTPSRKNPEYFADTGGHRWVKSQELRDGPISETGERITDLGLTNSSAKYYDAGTVLIAMYGATVGRLGVLRVPAAVNQAICALAVDPEIADARYVYYALLATRSELTRQAAGAAQQNLNQGLIRRFRIPSPAPEEQAAVGSFLAAFDETIDLNRRRIAILEANARLLFQESFAAPGADGELPAGWRTSRLGDELAVLESGSRPRGGVDPDERGVPSVGAENVFGIGRHRYEAEKYISDTFFESMRRGRLEDGDVLLYKDGAYIGRHTLVRDGFPHERCAINEHVFRLRVHEPLTQSYLYFWLDRPETVAEVVALNSNAAQPGLNQAKLATLTLPVPPTHLVEQWEMTIEPILSLLFNLARQNRVLSRMRDVLVPRLIGGGAGLPASSAPPGGG